MATARMLPTAAAMNALRSASAAVQGLTLAHFRSQLEDLRERINHVRAQLEHLQDTSTAQFGLFGGYLGYLGKG
jgi:hypothetical protein